MRAGLRDCRGPVTHTPGTENEATNPVTTSTHDLSAAGAAYDETGQRIHPDTVTGYGYALCRCAVMSPLPLLDEHERRRWHTAHRQSVASAQSRRNPVSAVV